MLLLGCWAATTWCFNTSEVFERLVTMHAQCGWRHGCAGFGRASVKVDTTRCFLQCGVLLVDRRSRMCNTDSSANS